MNLLWMGWKIGGSDSLHGTLLKKLSLILIFSILILIAAIHFLEVLNYGIN